MKYLQYQLHIDGQPQASYTRMTEAQAQRTNETGACYGHAYVQDGMPCHRAFDVVQVDGTRKTHDGFRAYHEHLSEGGMDACRRRCVEYIRSQTKPA